MRCVLGVDGGGSKCDALLVREDGVALGWGHADVSDPGAGRAWQGSGRSQKTISRAGYKALQGLDDAVERCGELHISSVSGWLPLGFWRRSPVDLVMVNVVQEYEAAFAQAGEACGVVALAGTGAFVYAQTHDNRRLFLDGLGPLLGDAGGGYSVGFMAIRAAAKHDWGERHATSLTEPIYATLDISRRSYGGYALIGVLNGEQRDRGEIAALARIVNAEAEKGDRIAGEILDTAAGDMAETLYDALQHVGITNEAYPLVCTGGMMRSRRFRETFCARAVAIAPGLRPVHSPLPAVVGIALPTLYKLGAADPETLRANLLDSMPALLEANADATADVLIEPIATYRIQPRP